VTREGFEYELTMNLEFVNDKHLVKASKDRTSLFMGLPEFIPSIETGEKIKNWCESGAELPEPTKEQFEGLLTYLSGTPEQAEKAKQALKKYKLSTEQLKQIDQLL